MEAIPIELIRCDIEARVNQDKGILWNQLSSFGQIDPIIVEGPSETGQYYIIDGERRYRMLKELKAREILCTVIRGITTTSQRNSTRLIMQSSHKRPTRGDQILLFKEAGQDPKILSSLPIYKQKSLLKAVKVPSDIRRQVEQSRASQDALDVIWIDLDIQEEYRDGLIARLYKREIGEVHANGLRKLVRCPEYKELNEAQREYAIEVVLGQAKFTDHDADQIVIEAMMQYDPNQHYVGYWVSYLSHQIDDIRKKLNFNYVEHTSPQARDTLLTAIRSLNDAVASVFNGDVNGLADEIDPEPEDNLRAKSKLRLIDAARDMKAVTFGTSSKVVTPRFVPYDGGLRVIFPEG